MGSKISNFVHSAAKKIRGSSESRKKSNKTKSRVNNEIELKLMGDAAKNIYSRGIKNPETLPKPVGQEILKETKLIEESLNKETEKYKNSKTNKILDRIITVFSFSMRSLPAIGMLVLALGLIPSGIAAIAIASPFPVMVAMMVAGGVAGLSVVCAILTLASTATTIIYNCATLSKAEQAELNYRASLLLNSILNEIEDDENIDYNAFIEQLKQKINSPSVIKDTRQLLSTMYEYIDFICDMRSFNKEIKNAENQLEKYKQAGKSKEKIKGQENKITKLKEQEYQKTEANLAKITVLTKNIFIGLFTPFEEKIENQDIKKQFIEAKKEYFRKNLNEEMFTKELTLSLLTFTETIATEGATHLYSSRVSRIAGILADISNDTFAPDEKNEYKRYTSESRSLFNISTISAITTGIKQAVGIDSVEPKALPDNSVL